MEFKPEKSARWHQLNEAVSDVTHGPQLALMMNQQYKHNLEQAGPEWCSSGFPWLRYARAELYELMEHYNSYKHWKAHNPNLSQARLEYIDVLIFVMSHVIENGDPESFVRLFGSYLNGAEDAADEIRNSESLADLVNDSCERIVSVSFRGALDLQTLAELCVALDLDAERLEILYQTKMALNHLRTKNGYKEGRYLKTWFGQEDNEFIQENIVDNPTMQAALAEEPDQQKAIREALDVLYERAVRHAQEKAA